MDRTSFLGRISVSYEKLQDLFTSWAVGDAKLIVYEHEADDSVKRTHCHFLMLNSPKESEALRERKIWKDFQFKGNKDYSFKTYSPIYELKSLTYFSKGHLQPKFMFGLPEDTPANAIREWVAKQTPGVRTEEVFIETKKKCKTTDMEIINLCVDKWKPTQSRSELYDAVRMVLMNYKSYHYRRMIEFCQAVLVFYNDEDSRQKVLRAL